MLDKEKHIKRLESFCGDLKGSGTYGVEVYWVNRDTGDGFHQELFFDIDDLNKLAKDIINKILEVKEKSSSELFCTIIEVNKK